MGFRRSAPSTLPPARRCGGQGFGFIRVESLLGLRVCKGSGFIGIEGLTGFIGVEDLSRLGVYVGVLFWLGVYRSLGT
jgi:hypothetical protein